MSEYARIRKAAKDLERAAAQAQLDWPMEIGPQGIVMMMSPLKRHELIAYRIGAQLRPQLEAGLIAHGGAAVEDAGLGRLRYPDLMVLPESVLEGTGEGVDPGDVQLVVEIVSPSNHRVDYGEKAEEYPAMGIPFYLVVDPRKGEERLTVLSDPHGKIYRSSHAYAFGEKVPVGAWELDASAFPTYGD